MRLCRSISSLAVGAIKEDIDVIDAFCATGIRGFRYAKENKNVKSLISLDIDPEAIKLAKKNAKANKIRSSSLVGNISRLAFDLAGDFVEVDPFGTPSPYLVDALRYFKPKKRAYLSVTATDVAVLCGGKTAPCMKNYHSKPLNCEFTHEIGLRILMKRIAHVASEFNMGMKPLISFSDQHYLKTIILLERSAEKANKTLKQIGHVSYCPHCGFRTHSLFPDPNCSNCGQKNEFAGQLWLGELHDPLFLKRMQKLSEKRNYSDHVKIASLLGLMLDEAGMPPYYYDLHHLCKLHKVQPVPRMKDVLGRLADKGYAAKRTHFSDISVKTDAPLKAIVEALSWKG